jgi:integrase
VHSEELGAYLAACPRDPEALMFTAPLGGPLRPHTWIKGFFKPALRAAGLPETLRLYDLRHTCASLLIAQGASVKAVQAQLGHATASITLDTYGHLFPSELEALAELAGADQDGRPGEPGADPARTSGRHAGRTAGR